MNRLLRCGGVAALLVVQGIFATQIARYESKLHDGLRAYRNWDAVGARASLKQAAKIYQGDLEVWRSWADVTLYMHDYPDQVEGEHDPEQLLGEAWRGYAEAVTRCPADSWSWTGLAEVALNYAEWREARDGLDLSELRLRGQGVLDPERAVAAGAALIAMELKPSAFYALDALAAMHESLGDLENAKRLYVESSRMMPAVSNHAWGSGRRFARPLYRAILEGLEQGMARSPEFERLWLHLEIVRFAREQGDYETALAHARRAVADADDGYAAYISRWELYRTLEQLGRFEEALAALKDARKYHANPRALSRSLGMLESRIGMWAEACVDLRQALRADLGNAALRGQSARACEQAGEVELARQLLREGFVLPTDQPALARALLDFELRQGRYNVAERLAQSWAADHPEHAEFQRWADGLARP